MKVLGIEFAPLNTPFHRRMETLCTGIATFLIIVLPLVSVSLSVYLFLFTKYWWCVFVYAVWIIIDKKTPENGGRAIKWVRALTLFKYAKSYFPVSVKVVPGFKLDPQVNYLGGWFPHGLLPIGVPIGLTCGYGEDFINHSMYTITINSNFYFPFFRDFILSLGMCSATPKSISNLLSSPDGGKLVLLPIGGSSEALNFKKEEYRIKLKNRKGFIKLAIKCGVPVVPIFSFGENDIFNQIIFPEHSIVRRLQYWIQQKTGLAPLVFSGRGLFQYTFGVLPFRKPINIVVGKPLDFGKSENPTAAEVDEAHQKFSEALVSIFEEYKYYYEKNPDKSTLVLE